MTVPVPRKNWGLHVHWLLEYLLEHGVSLDEISKVAGCQIADAARCVLPIDDYLEVMEWGARRLSAPHFGLDMADQVQAGRFGILGYLVRNSVNVAELCEMTTRYQPVFMRGMQFSFMNSGEGFEVHWEIFRPPSESVRQDVEFSLAAFLRMFRLPLGDEICPRKTFFSHEYREPLQRYEQTFGPGVHFGAEKNYMLFDTELLQMPISDGDPVLLDILKQQADAMLRQWEDNESFLGKARLHIATSLEEEDAGAETVANRLHITTRTLNRQLKREGTNYQRLREEVIVELAIRSLAESDASITAIGGKLGYSESSAFVRAFKRMTGTTPVAYRQKARPSS